MYNNYNKIYGTYYTIIHKETIFTCAKRCWWLIQWEKKKGKEKKKRPAFSLKNRKSKRTDGTKKPKATRRFKANDIENYTKSKHFRHSIYRDCKIRCKIQLHADYKQSLVAELSQWAKCLLRRHEYLSLNPSTHIKAGCSHRHLNCPALAGKGHRWPGLTD